jgi:hypothetical protein
MAERQQTSPGQATSELSRCPSCRCDLVYPLDWAPAGALGWNIALRCPECEWRGAGTFPQDVADRFDDSLDESTQTLLDDLEIMVRANMEEEIERFSGALARNLILPEDF